MLLRLLVFTMILLGVSANASGQSFQKAILRHRNSAMTDTLWRGQHLKLWVATASGKEKKMRGNLEKISSDSLYLNANRAVALDQIRQIQYRPAHLRILIWILLVAAFLLMGSLSMLALVAIAEPVSLDLVLVLLALGLGALTAGLVLNRKARHRFADFQSAWTVEVVESPVRFPAAQIP